MPHAAVEALAWETYQRLRFGEPISGLTALLPWLAKVTDTQGRTLLHVAVSLCRPEAVAALMAAGADPFAEDHDGHTAITSDSPKYILNAAGMGQFSAVHFL